MVFSSIEFLLYFLPVFLIVYGLTPDKMKNSALLAGSLIFYAFGDVKCLPLLMVSVLINYFVGLHLEPKAGGKKTVGAGNGTKQGQKRSGKKKRKTTYRKTARGRLEKRRRWLFVTAICLNVGLLAVFKYFIKGSLPLGISFYT